MADRSATTVHKKPCSRHYKRCCCGFEKRLFAPPTRGQGGKALWWGVGENPTKPRPVKRK